MSDSIKGHLENFLEQNGLIYHVTGVSINKEASKHGEDAVFIEAVTTGDVTRKYLQAWYLKRNKMSNIDIAEDFASKLDKTMRGTIDE